MNFATWGLLVPDVFFQMCEKSVDTILHNDQGSVNDDNWYMLRIFDEK